MTPFDFLNKLWQYKPEDQYILIWTGADKRSRWFLNIEEAANYAAACVGDVYTGVGLAGKDYGPYNRCTSAEITGIAGANGDFDMVSEAHAGKALPETVEQALSIHPPSLKATFTILTGNGIQSWWLLKEPYMFDNAADRDAVVTTLARWHTLLKVNAQRQCWAYEKLADLARLLRIPGTRNCKDPRKIKDVTLHSADFTRLYNLSDFDEVVDYAGIADPAARDKAVQEWRAQFTTGPLTVNSDARVPQELLDRWMDPANSDPEFAGRFRDTWARQRKDLQDQTNSGYDMALVHFGLEVGLEDQRVVDLIIHHRAHNGQKQKLDAGYFRRTITKARAVRAEGQKPVTIPMPVHLAPPEPASATSVSPPVNGAPQPACARPIATSAPRPELAQLWEQREENRKLQVCQGLSLILGIEITKMVKIEGKDPTYHMHTGTGVVEFPSVAELLTFRLLELRIAASKINRLINKVKPKEWEHVRAQFLDACIIEEATDDETFEGGAQNDINDYLTETDFIDVIEGQRVQDQKKPMLVDGRITLTSVDLAAYVEKTKNRKMSPKAAASIIKLVGGTKTQRLRASRYASQVRWALPPEGFDPRQIKPTLFPADAAKIAPQEARDGR